MAPVERSMTLVSGPNTTFRQQRFDPRNGEVATDATAVYPLTHSQEGIWIDYLARPESTQYNLYLDLDFASAGDGTNTSNTPTTAVVLES